jgi:hypothetical protein
MLGTKEQALYMCCNWKIQSGIMRVVHNLEIRCTGRYVTNISRIHYNYLIIKFNIISHINYIAFFKYHFSVNICHFSK